jgi:hypothetical protein
VYPTSGKIGSKITIYGTGFDKTANSVVFASSDIATNSCSFTYNNLASTDGQKISIALVKPSSIICGQTVETEKPTDLVSGSYDVSVNVGASGSYTKAKLIKFTVTGATATISATPTK